MRFLHLLVFLSTLAAWTPGWAQPADVFREGFETWEAEAAPAGWRANGAGWALERDAVRPGEGAASAHLVAGEGERAPFGVLMHTLPAGQVRGKRIRLSALVRTPATPEGKTGLWMRVDRAGGGRGFFDNMADRPIVAPEWSRFVIEGDIAPDAERIAFGLLQTGGGAAWLDDVRIEVIGDAAAQGPVAALFAESAGPDDRPPAPLTARGLANLHALAVALGRARYFHPSDEAATADWDRLAMAAVERVETARTPGDLSQAMRDVLEPLAPSIIPGRTAEPPSGSVPVAWRHQGVQTRYDSVYRSERIVAPEGLAADPLDLGDGVVIDLPLTVWRGPDGRTWPRADRPPLRASRPEDQPPSAFDRTTRLAAVILAWSTLRDFYPYFDVVEADWDGALDRALQKAALDADPRAFGETLQALTAALQDGHARVSSPWLRKGRAPVALDHIEGRVVVVGVAGGAGDLRVGDRLVAVDGTPVEIRLAHEASLASGSPQWRRHLALTQLLSSVSPDVAVTAERADGARFETRVAVQASGQPPLREPRPEPVADLGDGLLYVDVTRLDEVALEAARPRMESAAGVVFDLRGYPQAQPWYLARLSGRTVRSAPFDLPTYLRPGQAGVVWDSRPWVIQPRTPAIERAVFITDESAISFAESILGAVAGEGLAPIVGEPTAGANGNVNAIDLPGGYRIFWTGMRVTRHDGGRHHNVGVQPTAPLERTLAGVRAGRDELLEHAVTLLKSSPEAR